MTIFKVVRALVCSARRQSLEAIQFLIECCWEHFDWLEHSGLWDQDLSVRIRRTLDKEATLKISLPVSVREIDVEVEK